MSDISFTAVEFKAGTIAKVDPKEKVCLSCHYEGRGRFPGSYWLYPPLFFFGVIPGLAYYLYRTASGQSRCFNCGKKSLVPASSPMGIAIHNENLDRQRVARDGPKATEVRVDMKGNVATQEDELLIARLQRLRGMKSFQRLRMFLPKDATVATVTISQVDPYNTVVDQIESFRIDGVLLRLIEEGRTIEARFSPSDAGKCVHVFVAEMAATS